MPNKQTGKTVDTDIDALFRLPLSEFISARKTLAARLKQEGRADDVARVKALVKPPISVWAVNQLYWRHRDEFDQLIAAGQRFRRAHTSRTGKVGELNEALEARRDALNHLSELAADLLRDAGHSPALDTMRRIATTLEAVSAYPVLPDGEVPGRLTRDLDPPGFESLAPFIRAVASTRRPDQTAAPKPAAAATKTGKNSPTIKEARRVADSREAKLAAGKLAVRNGRKSLAEARAKAQSLQAAQKKADAEVKNAEKQKREAEQRFKEASAASASAAVRAQNIAREVERAVKAVDEAERLVEREAKDFESLFRESSAP
jgi:hypothetical protein